VRDEHFNDVDDQGTRRVSDEARRPLYNFWVLIMGIGMLFLLGFLVLVGIFR